MYIVNMNMALDFLTVVNVTELHRVNQLAFLLRMLWANRNCWKQEDFSGRKLKISPSNFGRKTLQNDNIVLLCRKENMSSIKGTDHKPMGSEFYDVWRCLWEKLFSAKNGPNVPGKTLTILWCLVMLTLLSVPKFSVNLHLLEKICGILMQIQ